MPAMAPGAVRRSANCDSGIMTRRRPFLPPLQWAVLLVVVLLAGVAKPASASLSFNYYFNRGCRDVETIVRTAVINASLTDSRIFASLLRLHFHDCFVNGCDGSILLKNNATFVGEQSAFPNANSVRGFEVIDNIKAAVEAKCPKTVSCADILAIAARDSVALAGGPHWEVRLGRYDSFSANRTEANNKLPPPFANVTRLTTMFEAVDLSKIDLVVLSGAHTFGKAQCGSVTTPGNSRLYNWSQNSDLTSGTGRPDPNIDPTFLQSLQTACPLGGAGNVLNNLDNSTATTFDNKYFKNLVAKKGFLNSDQALAYQSSFTAGLVNLYANSQATWFGAFTVSMIKMGNIEPKGASNGEIRKQCGFPNA